MRNVTTFHEQTTVAARIAGEDIQVGDYLTALNETVELPSFLWSCSDSTLPTDEPVRTIYKPNDAGRPFKVIAVCLPFVYTKQLEGGTAIFDTRKHQLVRLDRMAGRAIWKRMRRSQKKKRK